MRNLQLSPTITLGKSDIRAVLKVYQEEKSTAKSHLAMTWGGKSEADALRQLADALDHYGSWEAVQMAYEQAR